MCASNGAFRKNLNSIWHWENLKHSKRDDAYIRIWCLRWKCDGKLVGRLLKLQWLTIRQKPCRENLRRQVGGPERACWPVKDVDVDIAASRCHAESRLALNWPVRGVIDGVAIESDPLANGA